MTDDSSSAHIPFDHDFSDTIATNAAPDSTPTPRIKLKLRLNPSQPSDDDVKKKRHKHKKKHHHKKHKKRQGEEDEMADSDGQWRRRESEQVNIDDEEMEEAESQSNHIPVGGKRPFAILHASEDKDPQNADSQFGYGPDASEIEDEDDEYQVESYHPMETSTEPSTPSHTSLKYDKSLKLEKPKKRGRPSKARLAAVAAAAAAAAERATSEFIKKDFGAVCDKLLESLIKRDAYGFFLDPIDPNLVPDYATIIKNPMDFSTMRNKLKTHQYQHMDQVRHDFMLIVTNAKTYNAPNTIYWKNADKLQNYGIKAIERAERTVSYEPIAETVAHVDKSRQNSWPRKLSLMSVKKEPSVKAEEEVDILGLDNNNPMPFRKASRQDSESAGTTREASVDFASGSRALTPIRGQSKKKKKKKSTEAGVIYAPDGSVSVVGGVADVSTLLPIESAFCDPPQFVTLNPQALPSAFYLNRMEDWFTKKHLIHPAYFCDYGPFTTLGVQAPGEFYTAQDASYIYPLYGTGQGEAYMRSLWDFVDDLDLHESIADKSRYLTRGAWDVVAQVLKGKEGSAAVETEFGTVDVPTILEAANK